ncbi:hypothetical protein SAMN06273572_1191, partial [Monaibacterium marinum]
MHPDRNARQHGTTHLPRRARRLSVFGTGDGVTGYHHLRFAFFNLDPTPRSELRS